MAETDLRSLALFFFFAFLDGRRAIRASTLALSEFEERRRRDPALPAPVAIVMATHQVWGDLKSERAEPVAAIIDQKGWELPEGVDLGPWREFRRLNMNSDELPAVIWSRILGFSDATIAAGLGLSEGTVQYRLGKAFRMISEMHHVAMREG